MEILFLWPGPTYGRTSDLNISIFKIQQGGLSFVGAFNMPPPELAKSPKWRNPQNCEIHEIPEIAKSPDLRNSRNPQNCEISRLAEFPKSLKLRNPCICKILRHPRNPMSCVCFDASSCVAVASSLFPRSRLAAGSV